VVPAFLEDRLALLPEKAEIRIVFVDGEATPDRQLGLKIDAEFVRRQESGLENDICFRDERR
jgi:hypothetical protein